MDNELTKQESVSRQSSILKPSKQRQPLQCVVTNPSSSENSPTIKIKRRVSFAKNKRIREFCNEAEQGTVWDNTYEEHDLSSTKSSSSGNDQPVIITVPCDDKENFPVQLFLPNNQLECKEVPLSVPCEEGDNLLQCDMEMDSSINNFQLSNVETENNEIEYPNTTIYCDEGMEMTTFIQSEIVPCHNQEIKVINDTVSVSQTCIQNISMDMTENLPVAFYRKPIIQGQRSKNQYDLNSASNSTDLTQAISTLLGVGHSNKLIDPKKDLQNINTGTGGEKLDFSLTAPMEFISILPSSTWIRPNSQLQNDEKTENFTKTMDFTMAVPCNNIQINQNSDKINLTEKTKIFSNKSMEMTETVPIQRIFQTGTGTEKESNNVTEEKTKIFSNKSMDITETIPVYKNVDQFLNHTERIIEDLTLDNTKLFANKTMEMSETIPIYNDLDLSSKKAKKLLHEVTQEKTKIFSNKSMDLTEAISTYNKKDQCYSRAESQEKTKIFSNVSMELTEAIHTRNKNHQPIIKEKTNVFVDKSMEITEPLVPVHNTNHQLLNNTENFSHELTQEKTKIFANKSMEITEGIPIYNNLQQKVNQTKTLLHEPLYEKTKIFSNQSMDMTETLTVYDSKDKILNNKTQEKTKIFSDISMEMTEAVSMINTDNQCKVITRTNNSACQERTEIFVNKSMEITEAIPVFEKICHFNTDNQKMNVSETVQHKEKLLPNMSTEMTETVPIANKIFKPNADSEDKFPVTEEKTKIFSNKSMEMTETVPVYNTVYESNENANKIRHRSSERNTPFYNKSKLTTDINKQFDSNGEKILQNLLQDKIPCLLNEEKTKIFCDTSIDITEAIPIEQKVPNELNKQDSNEEKTEYFCNKSMDITEAIPVQQNILFNIENEKKIHTTQEKTKVFMNNAMNISETIALPNIRRQQEFPNVVIDDKTEFFCNKSMDITEAVPLQQDVLLDMRNKLLTKVQDKTKIFLDKSMDVTETIPIYQELLASNSSNQKKLSEVLQEKTKIFLDNSMDMTQTVAAFKVNSHFITETTNVPNKATELFQNISMDITSNLPNVPIITQNNPGSVIHKNFSYISQPEDNQCLQDNVKRKEVNTSVTKVYHDDSMEMTMGVPVIQKVVKDFRTQCKSDSKNMKHDILETTSNNSILYSKGSKSLENVVDVSSKLETEIKSANSNKNTNHQPIYESTKVFENASMEFTGIPSLLSSITKDTKGFNQYSNQSILNRSDGTRLSMNVSNLNKENNYEISNKFSTGDENFLRMTSDELNTLCASMNFPTQNYTTDETAAIQNNYINSCNDINVLRDSLQKDTIFQQPESSTKNRVFSEENNLHTPALYEKDSKENNSIRVCEAMEQSITGLRREARALSTTIDMSILPSSAQDKSEIMQNNISISNGTNVLCNSMTMSVSAIETDKTTEISMHTEPQQLSNLPNIGGNSEYRNQQSNQNIHNTHMDVSTIQQYPVSETVEVCQSMNVSEKNLNGLSSATKNTNNLNENETIQVIPEEKSPNNKLHIHHDVSLELVTVSSPPYKKRKSNEINEYVHKENIVSNVANINTSAEFYENLSKADNHMALKENSLSRFPSDNTDVLIATMGFKTQLPHPLIMNEKTVITVSRKSIANKTYTEGTKSIIESQMEINKTYVVNKDKNVENQAQQINNKIQNEDKNVLQNAKIPTIGNDLVENNIEEYDSSDKENKEPSIRVNLFPDNNSEELEEIQPPSFLCSDSIQEDSIEHIKLSSNDHLNLSSIMTSKENANTLSSELESNIKTISPKGSENSSTKELKKFSYKEPSSFTAKILQLKEREKFLLDELKKLSKEESDSLCTEKKRSKEILSSKKNIKQTEKNSVQKMNKSPCEKESNIPEEPLSPFLSLLENIKTHEKRDDCIWAVKTINPKFVAINFITKSFVIVVRLNEMGKACIKDIEKIEIISRLRDSKNILLSIVHNLLLSKLNPSEMLEKYKMYEDILPMLEYVSNEVISAMKFMFDLEKLSALNLLSVNKERILFKVASRKSNIILKVSLKLKVFEEIEPDDIDVVCILGDIRKSDIKQLIVNIRRDYTFLSRYINDIKDYITLMEESSSLNKH